MSGSEKPKSWKERKQSIKHKGAVPFVYFEWRCEQLSELLKGWAFLDILGHVGRLLILVAVISYVKGCSERTTQADNLRKARQYQAWQVINSAQGKTGGGGRKDALEDLHKDNVLLAGVDISYAVVPGINLTGANLIGANLTEAIISDSDLSSANLRYARLYAANLFRTNLAGADLNHADLRLANLTGANLKDIGNWKTMLIENANIADVENASKDFLEWAKDKTVSFSDDDEWLDFRGPKIVK